MARFTTRTHVRPRFPVWLAVFAIAWMTTGAVQADRGVVTPSGDFTFPGKYLFGDDFPNGNGNFSADGGEVVDMEVYLLNDTGMGQTGITATILSAEPAAFVEVLLGTVAYPDMPDSNTESNFADLFQLRFGAGIPCRHIDLTIGLSTDQGTYSVDLKLPLGQLTTFDDQLFVDSFEFGPGKWTLDGQWYYAQTSTCTSPTLGYVSPTRSMVFNKKATCEVGVLPETGALTMANPVYVPAGLGAPFLEFHHLLSMPFDAEVVLEYMLNNSGTWELLEDYSGQAGTWALESIPIDHLSGNDVHFRFRVDLQPGMVVRGADRGWFIDDVAVIGDRYACGTFTAPTPTLPPCPTGTPAPTFTATPTPTATVAPTSTPPVFVPAIFSVEGQTGQILANHSGVAPGGLRHFVAFWSRDANSQLNRWTYHGYVEYSDGQIQTSIPWAGPDANTRHELAARLFIEGTGFSGPIVYGIATDLPKVFPEISDLLYNDGNLSLDVTLNPGGLTSSLGMWSRPIIVQASPAPAEETGSWTYHGVTPYDLGSSFQHLGFDRAGSHFTMAAGVYAKGLGFLHELCYAAAPDFLEVFPNLKSVTANPVTQEITVEFRPAGNQPVEIGIWFREVDMSTCEPMCDWTFYGFHPYALNKREQVIPWFPADSSGHYQVAARMYVNHAFFDGFMGSYVFALPCSPVTTPPGTPSPTPSPSPSPTIAPTPTFTPTPTVTPMATRRTGNSEKPGIKGGVTVR